jgi:TetR/AcrR family transcriptional regulator
MSGLEQLGDVIRKAYRAGFLRSDFHPVIQISLVSQACLSYIASIPLYQTLVPGEDLGSAASLARARTFLVDAVVHAMMREE